MWSLADLSIRGCPAQHVPVLLKLLWRNLELPIQQQEHLLLQRVDLIQAEAPNLPIEGIRVEDIVLEFRGQRHASHHQAVDTQGADDAWLLLDGTVDVDHRNDKALDATGHVLLNPNDVVGDAHAGCSGTMEAGRCPRIGVLVDHRLLLQDANQASHDRHIHLPHHDFLKRLLWNSSSLFRRRPGSGRRRPLHGLRRHGACRWPRDRPRGRPRSLRTIRCRLRHLPLRLCRLRHKHGRAKHRGFAARLPASTLGRAPAGVKTAVATTAAAAQVARLRLRDLLRNARDHFAHNGHLREP
mmetsp:Transcript_31288/g.103975  ORF Transcript_31288/g.103975 Transcript_31288/m.103975 type:complete len:298 (+) Transcript_31288:142-1035(+)